MNRNNNGASQQVTNKEQKDGAITFTLDAKSAERVRILAFKANVSKSEFVREIVLNHLHSKSKSK